MAMLLLKNMTKVRLVKNSDEAYAEIVAYKFTMEAIVCLERIFKD